VSVCVSDFAKLVFSIHSVSHCIGRLCAYALRKVTSLVVSAASLAVFASESQLHPFIAPICDATVTVDE